MPVWFAAENTGFQFPGKGEPKPLRQADGREVFRINTGVRRLDFQPVCHYRQDRPHGLRHKPPSPECALQVIADLGAPGIPVPAVEAAGPDFSPPSFKMRIQRCCRLGCGAV